MSAQRWITLEANPEIINAYSWNLGLDKSYAFYDVWGLDDDLLAFLPAPIQAFLLLFPITENYERARKDEETQLVSQKLSKNIIYIKQTIANACGTMAILHALLNSQIKIIDNSALAKLQKQFQDLSPLNRAKLLELNTDLADAHAEVAALGQTSAPNAQESTDLHFTALVQIDGDLYELDGRKTDPVNHGPVTDFAKDAARIIKTFMARDPGDVQFNLIALGPNLS